MLYNVPFDDSVIITTSFQKSGMVLIDKIFKQYGYIPWDIVSVDTGYLFEETIEFSKMIEEEYGFETKWICSGSEEKPGSDDCCTKRKVEVLFNALAGKKHWVNAIRQDQTEERKKFNRNVFYDKDLKLFRVMPLLFFNNDYIEEYICTNNLLIHPLYAKGYTSIGCKTCTVPTHGIAEDRTGRWKGIDKNECGIHMVR